MVAGWCVRTLSKDLEAVDTKTVYIIIFNIVSSLSIVFLNKWAYLYNGFNFSITLTFLHFLTTAIGLQLCAWFGIFQTKRLPFYNVFLLSLTFCGFVASANMSLQLNSVGFYQMFKVLTTPVIVVIQSVFMSVNISHALKFSLVWICIGVMIATFTDFQLNLFGFLVASFSVVVTSVYQIWVGKFQKDLQADSMQLLYYQAPLSAVMLLSCIPFLDEFQELKHFRPTNEGLYVVGLSCLASFFVNLSIFLLIGKTSPITYNAVGHTKLCLVIVGGFLIFHQPITLMNVVGIVLALSGLILYTHLKLSEDSNKPAPQAATNETQTAADEVAPAPASELKIDPIVAVSSTSPIPSPKLVDGHEE